MCRICDGDGCMLCDRSYEDAEWRSLCEEYSGDICEECDDEEEII